MRNRVMAAAGLGGAIIGAALAAVVVTWSGPVGSAEGNEVSIDNFTFGPDKLVVPAGTTVTWRNADDIPHTVASSSKLFKSKALDTDDSYSFTFATAGVYDYFCSLHPQMKGTIVVEAAADKK